MPKATTAAPKTQLTAEGYADLEHELKELEEVRMPALLIRLENARNQGDLSENADYHSAKEDQELLETRIGELKMVLANSTIVHPTHKNGAIGVGSQVSVQIISKKSKKKTTLHIMGDFESDPVNGKISGSSPIGKALMGKKKGDKVDVTTPAGVITYEILEVK